MKVLAISSYGGLGGAELATATFLEHRPDGIRVRGLLVEDGPLRPRLEGLGVPTRTAVGCEGAAAGHLLRFGRVLGPMLDADPPDVVWAMGTKAAVLAVGPCRRRGVPLVWHKVDFSWDRRLALPLAAAVSGVIAVSHAVAEAVGPLRRRRLLGVVGPPLDLPEDLRARLDPERPAIGTLARLVPYKGHTHLLRAAALLAADFPALEVLLAGDAAPQYPDYPASLRELAREAGIEDRVRLLGFVEDVGPLLERLTVYVNATYRDEDDFGLEGLSGAMLEASWVGVPVVATRGGGTDEGVLDGVTGTLVDRPDAEALAAAISAYLADPAVARETGAAGRRFARERFRADAGARRVFDLLARAA